MKIFRISCIALLASLSISDTATAKTLNLLENFVTSDESQLCDKSKFYEHWECYWKEGEAVPEELRPSSYYSIIKFNESGQGKVPTLTDNKELLLSGISKLGFEDGMHVVVLDYPSSKEAYDLYYRIPINVPQTGEYYIKGTIFITPDKPEYFVDEVVNNFCTEKTFAVFAAESEPAQKDISINEHYQLVVENKASNKVYSNAYFLINNETNLDTKIYLDKDDKYLALYGPALKKPQKSNNAKYVLVLGNMRLEPVDPIVVPEPEPEPLCFKHFARTLFEPQNYDLRTLGLKVPQGFDAEASGVTVTCDDDKRFKLEGEGLNTTVKVVGSHVYEGGDNRLPYATLTVSYTDESGVSQAAVLKLHVPSGRQITQSNFDFTQSDMKEADSSDSAIGAKSEIYMRSDTGAWKARFANDSTDSDANATNGVVSGTQPTYTYQEGAGWRIDFGNEVGRFKLRFDANMAESHYTKNPAYALNEIWLNMDQTSAQELRVLAVEENGGKTEYKELEKDNKDGEPYFVGYDASMSKEIVIEASGSVTLKKAELSFISNFEIPRPSFMNVTANNNETSKDTYIELKLPTDENGKAYWDDQNKLQIQYMIEADPDAIGIYGPETDTNTVSDSDTPTWNNYAPGQKVTCDRYQKITARVVHPHGMISLPNFVDYSVVTGVEELQVENVASINDANCTRYFTLQGIETSEPQGDIYIMVKEGKTHLVRK